MTLTLDPDVAQMLQLRMAERHESLNEAVNQALRIGLAAGETIDTVRLPPFVVEPHACGLLDGVDRNRMNQLAADLETEEFLARFAVGQTDTRLDFRYM